MIWSKLRYLKKDNDIEDSNKNQIKRYLSRIEKISNGVNNATETLISVDINITNEGEDFLELVDPSELTVESAYMAHNLHIIEIVNAMIGAKLILANDHNESNHTGIHTLNITDMHLQKLALLQKIIPKIEVTDSDNIAIASVIDINPLPNKTYNFKIYFGGFTTTIVGNERIISGGTHISIPMMSFSEASYAYLILAQYYATSQHNVTITQPLLPFMRSLCNNINDIKRQVESLL